MSNEQDTPPDPSLPDYRVERYLGGGASGLVWAVTRTTDDARLAAKVLLAPVESALTEVACLERLVHEHVLRLHETVIDVTGPHPRLAMVTDLAEGGSLGDAIVRRGHLTVGELVTVLTPIARTLHDLHGQGLVHGDLSPANVLLDEDGKPLLGDFGVARLAAGVDAEVWGTPGFVAPEVLAGAAPDAASDVYALGAIAWTALVGEAPPPAALRPHLPDAAPQAPAAVCDLVLSCLSHTPPARPTAGELALAIWDSAEPEPAPRAGSEGARGARAPHDPWTGLTQRIRETAREVAPEEDRRWHQVRAVRRVLVAASVLGLIGGVVVVWPADEVRVRGEVLASPRPSADARRATASATVEPVPPRSARTTPPRPAPRLEPPAPPASVTRPSEAAPSARPSPPASARPGDPQLAALRQNPHAVVQHLVDARARAWTHGDRHLGTALVVDSAAWRRDQRDLRTAAAAGAGYRGLRFTVRSATVEHVTPTRARVAAVVDRSAYTVLGEPGGQVPASAGERAVLTLQRTPHGWRIADWAAG